MKLRMWSYDLAREQSPSIDYLRNLCSMSLDAGYNALGLYMEHRFAYPSAPWAKGIGAIDGDTVKTLIKEFPDLQIIPFVNLLGHMEGLLYTEEGKRYAEANFKGMQACPSKPELAELASKLIADVLDVFDSEIIHIGADEIGQLGSCELCKARVEEFEAAHPGGDGKAMLFGQYFAPLAKQVLDSGRRPGVWGDMFVEHPTALEYFPKETIIFDWQYFSSPKETAKRFFEAGHEVVFCPTIITYSAPWMHLPQAELNVKEHAASTEEMGALGVCVTTWECELFGNYNAVLPALKGAGKILQESTTFPATHATWEEYEQTKDSTYLLTAYKEESESYAEWARIMGSDLQECGELFAYGGIRSAIKARFLLYSNPFLLWLRNRDDLTGDGAKKALQLLDRAIAFAPNANVRGVSEFVRIAIEFVGHVEASAAAYADHRPGEALAALAPARAAFDDLAKIAKSNQLNTGGSLADLERCYACKEHVEKVMRRIRNYGDGSLGYLPSFETICHPKFVPHDQGNWWLINDWANE